MRKPEKIVFKFKQKFFNRINENFTVYVYPTIKSCMASCEGIPIEEIKEWNGVAGDGEFISHSINEAVKIFKYWRCWGYTVYDEIHLWYSKNVDEARLASIIAHEMGHMLKPQHRDEAREEAKANNYGTVTEVACRLAKSLIRDKKEGCLINKFSK